MSLPASAPHLIRFADFEVNLRSGELHKAGRKIKIQERPFQVLAVLLEHAGEVVPRDELSRRVWPADTFVDFDHNLAVAVKKIRDALGDSAEAPRFVETVGKRGYRFLEKTTPTLQNGVGLTAQAPSLSTALLPEIESEPAPPLERPPAKLTSRFKIGVVVVLLVIGMVSVILVRRSGGIGKLTDKDTIVLADFANSTGDPVFDDTLKQALSVAIRQSSFLSILSDDKAAATLKLMTRPRNAPLTPDVTREVCQRTGSRVYIAGAIASLGSEYVLGLKAVNCQSGDALVQEQLTVTGKEKVLNALGEASARMRRELGESLASVERFNKPLEEATTPSLEALQSLTQGLKKGAEGDYASAIPFCRRATELDPNFARAYACLGAAYRYIDETGLAIQNSRKAYELCGRCSDRERFYVESMYFHGVGDLERADETCTEWIQAYPNDATPRAFLVLSYENKGEFEKAVAEAQDEVRITRDACVAYTNLVAGYVSLNQPDQANAAFEEARLRKADCQSLRWAKYLSAFLQKDAAAMEEQMAWAAATPGAEDYMLSVQSDTEAYSGHFVKSRELSERSAALAKHADSPETAAYYLVSQALRDAEIGDPVRARREAMQSLALSTGRDVAVGAALTFARVGDAARAQHLAQKLSQDFPLDTMMQDYTLPTIRAAVELEKRNPDKAIDMLKVVIPYDLGGTSALGALYPAYVRGQAFSKSGRGREAVSEFQKMIDHPGVVANSILGPLAHLQMARAYMLSGEKKQSLAQYELFLDLWKDADSDVPVLRTAKAEYAKLN